MKRHINRILFAGCMACFTMAGNLEGLAQVPQYISYQAIVSDTAGNPVEGPVALRVSILHKSDTGKAVYTERHEREADKNGLVSLSIGKGDIIYQGELDTINWSDGPYFARIEMTPGRGYIYPISTTSELLSVPFAFFALKADSVSNSYTETDPRFSESVSSGISAEDTARWNALSKEAQFRIGDLYQGGIIFYIEPGGEHGLIASLNDVSTNTPWSVSVTITGAQSSFNGSENTASIVTLGAGDYAAYRCDTLTYGGYNDWYLPAADEVHLLFRARYVINKILDEDQDPKTVGLLVNHYWSSTEISADEAIVYIRGSSSYGMKNAPASVRAIRAF